MGLTMSEHTKITAFTPSSAYYAIPVAIFILVAILLVVCVTLWVVPYCVDHQRKRKRQTDAAKGANLDDDDDEISTGKRGSSKCIARCILENELLDCTHVHARSRTH